MITGYVKVEKPKKSLELFLEMLGLGIEPNGFTLSAVIKACSGLGDLRLGKCFHGVVMVRGFDLNDVISTALIDMYGRNSAVDDASLVFVELPQPDAVCWTSIISAFTRNDAYDKALGFFYSMCKVHAKVIASGLSGNVFVESSLVDMYGKCRLVNQSQCVFDRMSVKNLVSWTALLGGYCQNGRGGEVFQLFDEMIEEGIRPDYISFVGVLFACSHVGLVDQGKKYFAAMSEVYEIKPGIEHYNCMIDLLGRAGLLEEAENLIENANCRVLLGACAASPHSATAERIAKKAVELKPDHHLSYVYLANVYRAVGRWDDAVKIRNLMTKRGVGKMPGTSWIET
ncbi:hypothetical protein NC653_031675 [Populus alba x Populus x berolinensis]|uniref:Pentatricopeptide repeat-containing protein n=1 Tax=Populus alba x Populus x berolinensis TaxID=444605 RepID=A0AAD6Q1Y7_9ROSI|nr:hypothetical protein NC653_031675 [Populus alba x Populus x berolinensis]